MQGAKKDKKNPFFKSSYADLASVFEAIRVPFAENGLAVTQTMELLDGFRQALVTTLLHCSGESIQSKMVLPDIADPQKLGSAITYYRRYSLMAIAGIPAEDDDGNAASAATKDIKKPSKYITPDQVAQIEFLIKQHESIRKFVFESCGGSLETIPASRFDGAIQWIEQLIKDENDGKAEHA